LPVIERDRHLSIRKFFRGDAAFANPALYRVPEKEGYHDAIRIKANAVLEREIEHLLTRGLRAKGLAGRYFGRSEPRNRGCGGENVEKPPRDRRGGWGRSVL